MPTAKVTNSGPETRSSSGRRSGSPIWARCLLFTRSARAVPHASVFYPRHRSRSPENARAITDYAPVVIKNNNKKNVWKPKWISAFVSRPDVYTFLSQYLLMTTTRRTALQTKKLKPSANRVSGTLPAFHLKNRNNRLCDRFDSGGGEEGEGGYENIQFR